ncbi:hypothetical protein AK830_g10103 [Neonectria ditissima]|uniref:C2H2-type domain-containing protein n=1 Tax=Neonectria ditissima TaxID=78410 RepID=A0A0P7AQQ6_9HYPO|nr:hypothetical protein AK830_g10103 [Neonectria ditissima]
MEASNSGSGHRSGAESLGPSHQYAQSRPSPSEQPSAKPPYPWNLTRFYNMSEDSPWVPQGIVASIPSDTQSGQYLSAPVNSQPPAAFQGYRNSRPLQSECDTANDDSGYGGSGAPYSIENTSVYDDDQNPEAQNAQQLFEAFHLGVTPWAPPPPTPSVTTAPTSGEHKHYCTQCETWLRTKSELKADNFRSHLRRIHRKEYTAEDDLGEYTYSPPPLGEDLEGVGGSALSYIGTNQPAGIEKPTAHPFQQSFIGNQSIATNSRPGIPQLQDDLDSLDSILGNSTSTSSAKAPSTSDQVQEVDGDFMKPELLHGTGQSPFENSRTLDVRMTPRSTDQYHFTQQTHGSISGSCELSVCNDDDSLHLGDATESSEHGDERGNTSETGSSHPKGLGPNQSKAGQPDVKMTEVGPEQSSSVTRSSSDTIAINLLGLHKNPESVLEYLKTLPKELLKSALSEDVESSKATDPTQEPVYQKTVYPCTECLKKFVRQCELKKHLKRHEKPYGCTHAGCSKAFGSKNDWKRHESSQHWQLEVWKCADNKKDSQQPCDKVCHRRESFKHHLSKDHAMDDAKQIEEKLEKCRIGRHCDTRFWCGFCVKIIEITDKGVNAWTKRCDHIDDHFSGREGNKKRHINEWKQMEDVEQRREASVQSSKEESASTSNSGSSRLKRKLSADSENLPRKKQQQEVTAYMWQCSSHPTCMMAAHENDGKSKEKGK